MRKLTLTWTFFVTLVAGLINLCGNIGHNKLQSLSMPHNDEMIVRVSPRARFSSVPDPDLDPEYIAEIEGKQAEDVPGRDAVVEPERGGNW
jgi:hypothetical protein